MTPLAETLRPDSLDDVVGQDHLLDNEGFLRKAIAGKKPLSLILWGPPGCGKTTLARLYAKAFGARLISFSAVFSGIGDLRKVIKEVESQPLLNQKTILFVDEIHRFNKAQQDGFLPHLESGLLTLIGATTENPSFALNDALLSRIRVVTLHALSSNALETLLQRYETLRAPLPLTPKARAFLITAAQGDGRYLLNMVENLESTQAATLDEVQRAVQKRPALYDRAGDSHYNLISALHKAVRTSDPDAAVYWFARMLEGGEDPLFVARRLIRMASEDIGLADPQALCQAIAARDAYQMLGSPEGELALAQVVIYLSLAPKSNALYTAYKQARQTAKQSAHLPPPAHILNAPTKLMKQLGYGMNYQYDHDHNLGCSGQNTFPEKLEPQSFYQPVQRGFEREMEKRLQFFKKIRTAQQDA